MFWINPRFLTYLKLTLCHILCHVLNILQQNVRKQIFKLLQTRNKKITFSLNLYLVVDYYRFITNIHSKLFVRITETILIYCHFWLRYITPLVYQWPRTLKSPVIRVFTWWINPKSHADSDQCTVIWQDFNATWTNKRYSTDNWVIYIRYSFKAKVVENTSKKVS